MTQNAFDSRRWVLPLVSVIPILTIAFAFSLGPSPRKQLQVIYQAESVDEARLAEIVNKQDTVLAALIEDIEQPDLPHRVEIIEFMGRQNHTSAAWTLRQLAGDRTEPVSVRAAAFGALKTLDPKAQRDLAPSLRYESGALGQAAREVLAER